MATSLRRSPGRPPIDKTDGAHDTDPEDDPHLEITPPLRVWAEGEWVIPGRQGRERVIKDQLAQLLQQTTLKLFVQPLSSEHDTSRRRRYATLPKLDSNAVMSFLQDYPGAMVQDIVAHFYPGLGAQEYAAALNRVRVCLTRLGKEHRVESVAACYYPVTKTVKDELDKRIVVLAESYAAEFPEVPIAIRNRMAEIAVGQLATATTVRTYIAPEDFKRMLDESFAGDVARFAAACKHNETMVQHWLEYGVRGARKVSMVLDLVRNPEMDVVNTIVDMRKATVMLDTFIDGMRGAPAPDIFEPLPKPPTPVTDDELAATFFGAQPTSPQ